MIEFLPSREVVLQVGNVVLRWYGLLYVVAFWLGWWLVPRIARFPLRRDDVSYLTALVAVGVIVGGRLGYVLLYEPLYYMAHPIEIFFLNQGGMSAHGGFIGVALALWWGTKKQQMYFLALADVLVVPVAFGLALGRLGNFINQELYSGYWALGVATADLVLGLICWYLLAQRKFAEGGVAATFLIGYALIRFVNEFVRLDDWPSLWGLTYGQVLTIPILILGLWLVLKVKKFPVTWWPG